MEWADFEDLNRGLSATKSAPAPKTWRKPCPPPQIRVHLPDNRAEYIVTPFETSPVSCSDESSSHDSSFLYKSSVSPVMELSLSGLGVIGSISNFILLHRYLLSEYSAADTSGNPVKTVTHRLAVEIVASVILAFSLASFIRAKVPPLLCTSLGLLSLTLTPLVLNQHFTLQPLVASFAATVVLNVLGQLLVLSSAATIAVVHLAAGRAQVFGLLIVFLAVAFEIVAILEPVPPAEIAFVLQLSTIAFALLCGAVASIASLSRLMPRFSTATPPTSSLLLAACVDQWFLRLLPISLTGPMALTFAREQLHTWVDGNRSVDSVCWTLFPLYVPVILVVCLSSKIIRKHSAFLDAVAGRLISMISLTGMLTICLFAVIGFDTLQRRDTITAETEWKTSILYSLPVVTSSAFSSVSYISVLWLFSATCQEETLCLATTIFTGCWMTGIAMMQYAFLLFPQKLTITAILISQFASVVLFVWALMDLTLAPVRSPT